jgi:hypothetical protein
MQNKPVYRYEISRFFLFGDKIGKSGRFRSCVFESVSDLLFGSGFRPRVAYRYVTNNVLYHSLATVLGPTDSQSVGSIPMIKYWYYIHDVGFFIAVISSRMSVGSHLKVKMHSTYV